MKIEKIVDGIVLFDNGTRMFSEHESECCEHHWAEFSQLNLYNLNPKTGDVISITDLDFPERIEDNIQLIEGEGFNLVASDGSKYFVPCYGENNGYYSTNLELVIDKKVPLKVKIMIDLRDYQKIEWC